MDMEKTPEQGTPNPEADELLEELTIDNLPERLGFIETDELRLLKQAALVAHLEGKPEEVKELRDHYRLMSEQVINELQGERYTKAQIGLIVALGNLRRDTGRVDAYIRDVEEAWIYAAGMDYDEALSILEKALAQTQSDI